MVKKEFIELYYNENNTSSREEAKKQVDMFLKTMEKALMQNETIIFRGPVETAPRTTVRFKCGKKMETLLAGRKRSRKRK